MDGLVTALLILFAILGAPLFAIFGGASMGYFANMEDGQASFAANDVFTEKFSDSPLMVTIPLFIFAGYIMAESGTPRRLVRLSRAWLGWLPGGLAIVCIGASAYFTTFTGGSGITIVAVGGLLYPALISEKYPEKFSLGLVTSGGSLGLLFPPSLPLVLYGIIASISIEGLFFAGIVPGFLTLIALSIYAIYIGRKHKMPTVAFDGKEALQATWEAKWEVLLPFVLILGLGLGVLRIHEAAAFAAAYALIIEVWVYKDVSFRKDLPKIIRSSTTMFGAILAILATAIGFTGFLIQAQVPMKVLDAMSEIITDPIAFLLLLNIFLLVVGMLMDIFSAIVVVVPLIVPIAMSFVDPDTGQHLIDPYHLGIVFLLNLEIGYLTPPVGLNLFISSFRFEKPVTLLYRAVIPFILLLLAALLITTYVPALSTWLPNLIVPESMQEMPEPGTAADFEDELPVDGDEAPIDMDDLLGDDDELFLDDLEGDDIDLDDLEGDDFNLDDLEDGLDLAGPDSGTSAADESAADDGVFDLDDLEAELD